MKKLSKDRLIRIALRAVCVSLILIAVGFVALLAFLGLELMTVVITGCFMGAVVGAIIGDLDWKWGLF